MATTAKKPSKKPVKRVTKKTPAKTSPAKTATVKSSTAKPVAKPVAKLNSKGVLTLASIKKLNVISGITSAALAVISALLLIPASSQMVMNFMTRDGLASSAGVVLAPAQRVLGDVELRYLLAAIFTISAIGSLLLATALRRRYETTVTGETSGFRWLFVGISSALLLEFASLMAGIQDIATLKLIAALVLFTSLFSWLAERDNRGAVNAKWLAFVIALVAGALAWIPLVLSMAGTTLFGQERFSWYIYAFAGVLLVGFTGFAINLYRQIRVPGQGSNYLYAERGYLAIDLLMKIAVVAVIVAALHR